MTSSSVVLHRITSLVICQTNCPERWIGTERRICWNRPRPTEACMVRMADERALIGRNAFTKPRSGFDRSRRVMLCECVLTILGAGMTDVTRILSAIEQGDRQASEELLPLVYDELRRLATQRMAAEKPGQTLQATALVHEAYLRLVDVNQTLHWDSRGHFFAAAAEAMRRILVESARRKGGPRAGGG